jgi:hypothetical protein
LNTCGRRFLANEFSAINKLVDDLHGLVKLAADFFEVEKGLV